MAGRRVLLIEDEDHVREVAQMSLELMADWDVAVAASGEEGIHRARELRPELILLDVMMPDLDGPATFERLRADPTTASIPIIFLTAKARPADRVRLTELGALGVITKPFDPATLHLDIARLAEWPQ